MPDDHVKNRKLKMKKLILVICLISTPVFAQQKSQAQTQIESTIGALIVENVSLNLKVQELTKQIEDLKKVKVEKKD